MFTGIIQGVGTVRSIEPRGGDVTMTFDTGGVSLADVDTGGSIAVNGACLTAVRHAEGWFTADVSRETLNLTTLGEWTPGTRVNLEKALSTGSGACWRGTTTVARCGWSSRCRPNWPATSRARARCAWTG